jgi:hypothetical protein
MQKLFAIDKKEVNFIDEVRYNHLLQDPRTHLVNDPNPRCEIEIKNLRELSTVKNKHMVVARSACDLFLNDTLKQDNTFYKEVGSVFNNTAYKSVSVKEAFSSQYPHVHTASKIVGVHIRQGSVTDYVFGNFFGAWENSDTTNSPIFPQFKDACKNLSAYHKNAPPIETFIDAMNEYDESVMFFVCADRIGTLLYLYQKFPNRILLNPLVLPTERPDTKAAILDFTMLSKCDELIVSSRGSFSTEASIIRRAPIQEIR